MDQTEILKFHADPSTKNPELANDSVISNQLSKITTIKENTYERVHSNFEITEKTPKPDLTSKNSSSGRLVRISSSKRINVISARPSSSEKEVSEFVSCNNISPESGSEKAIKKDESLLMTQMRDALKNATQVYEDKMNQELSYQHSFLTAEIDHLKENLTENNTKLLKQQSELDELLSRVETVEKKIEAKTNSMAKELLEFKKFYEKCHTYTTERISEAENSVNYLKKFIESYISTSSNIESWKYIEYANGMIKRVVAECSMRTSELKYYLNDQLYDMEIGIGEFQDHYEKFDNLVSEMKSVTFENRSLKEYVKELGKFGINLDKVKNDSYKENFLEYYEPKFKDIVKKVNNATIEIDLMKNLIANQSKTSSVSEVAKIEELEKAVEILQKKILENNDEYKRQISLKEETLSRSNPRILELETKLHSSFEQEVKMLKEISELKLKISYLEIKSEKTSEREYNIQSTLAEAFAETLVKDKTKRFEEEISKKEVKIGGLEEKIKELDRENYLLAEKLSKNSENSKELIKLETELKYTTKIIQEFELEKKTMVDESTNNKKLKEEKEKQIEKLEREIELLTAKLNDMVKHKSAIDEDDNKYFDELEEEVDKCHEEIRKLNEVKNILEAKIEELNSKNSELENDLHTYAETFESQSMTFRTALQNLQKEKDYLTAENKRVLKENHCLRIDIEQTKTAQSFYENNSNVSLQLRKTVSTDLNYEKSNKKNNERHSFTTKLNKLAEFQNFLEQKQFSLPILCEIDETGYLKDEETGCYFADDNDNYFELDDKELSRAVEIGLILL